MQRIWTITGIAALVACIGAGAAVASWRVSSDADRVDAAEDLRVRTEDRDAVAEDVERAEDYLEKQERSLGRSAVPVRDEDVFAPKGVSENLLTGELAIGDFEDVFVDEGIVLTGIDAKEVDEIPLRDVDTIPPKPRPPFKAEAGYRLVQVDLRVTNRSGDGADPACGLAGSFNGQAFDDSGERALLLQESYAAVGTYPGSCGAGLADGESARIRLGVGLKEGDKLAALQFAFLGEGGSDGVTQVLVFDEPV